MTRAMPLAQDSLLPDWTRDSSFLLERGSAVAAVVVLTALFYLALSRGLAHAQRKGHLSEPIAATMRRLLRVVAVVAVILLSLQVLGVLQSALAALTALLAMVAIGFVAVWSVASNILCSLILLLARPFRVGDRVALIPDPIEGRVVNFNMLYTTLEADDGAFLQIPNNLFFQRVLRRQPGAKQIDLQEQLAVPENAEV